MNNTRASPTREVYAIPHQEMYRQLILSRLVNVGNTSIKNYKFCETQALHHSLQKGGTAARLTFSSVGVSNAYSQGRWLTVTHLLPCAHCRTSVALVHVRFDHPRWRKSTRFAQWKNIHNGDTRTKIDSIFTPFAFGIWERDWTCTCAVNMYIVAVVGLMSFSFTSYCLLLSFFAARLMRLWLPVAVPF